MKKAILIICVAMALGLIIWLTGCHAEQKLTRSEWDKQYKPETKEQANAMVILQTKLKETEAKVASMKLMDKFKFVCACIAGISLFVVLAFRQIKSAVEIGAAALLASLGGFALACADFRYGWLIAIIGVGIIIIGAGAMLFIVWRALIQVVKGGEKFLNVELPQKTKELTNTLILRDVECAFENGQRDVQTPATTKLVKKIKKDLENKIIKKEIKKELEKENSKI